LKTATKAYLKPSKSSYKALCCRLLRRLKSQLSKHAHRRGRESLWRFCD
jgi:hypothetical protein